MDIRRHTASETQADAPRLHGVADNAFAPWLGPGGDQDDWIFTTLAPVFGLASLDFDRSASTIGHALIVGGSGLVSNSGTPDQSSALALAVPGARSEYSAATGGTLTGAGLTIGILSDSFNLNGGMASDIAHGYLSSAIDILKEGSAGSEDEGRAMAQMIYQIAPGVTIDFYTATDSEADFAAGIGSLVAAGCNVIVDDVVYTDEPFYQDTGALTKAVESAIAAGVDYFTSANNSSDNFYEAAFTPLSGIVGKFALPGIGSVVTNNVAGSGAPYEAVALQVDPNLDLTVEWTQPYGGNTYDLGVGLYSLSNGIYTLVDDFFNARTSFNNTKTAIVTANPTLTIQTNETLAAGTYYLAFYVAAGTLAANSTFKIIGFQDTDGTIDGLGSASGSGVSIGHELVPAANTVAAVWYAQTPEGGSVSPPQVENFSAYGPGETYINAAGTTLASPVSDNVPDFAATDGTPSTVFPYFFGTSAAAPNAAAVSLLMLQADGRLTTTQVTTLLDRSAIATASTLNGGAGLIQADTAVAAAITAAATPIWTMQAATTQWSLAANWSDDAVPGQASVVQLSDGLGLFAGAYGVSYGVASSAVAGLVVDGGIYLPARPTLTVQAADMLSVGSLVVGAGSISVAGSLVDAGSLGPGSAGGSISIGAQGWLSIGGAAAGASIAYGGSGGTLVFSTTDAATLASGLTVAISGFGTGDVLDLAGLAASSVAAVHVSGSAVTVVNSAGATLAVLDIVGAPAGMTFARDQGTGTELVACYLEGTRIATPSGERPIEVLRIGDAVLTASEEARPIRWIGRRRYAAARVAGNAELQPIRFPAGCLGGGLPRRDLFVSPRHAMLLGGVLAPANRLLGWNGIARAALAGEVAYLHIELDSHDALLAEGAASESYADTGNRHMFDNAAECQAAPVSAAAFAPRLLDRAA